MELMPIRSVSLAYGVSTRTLRYYEEVGLLQSTRQPGSAYRAYDGEALRRLKQILVLRALRLPLKQIGAILKGDSIAPAINLLERHAQAIATEMDTLALIQTGLREIINQLRQTGQLASAGTSLDEDTARRLVRALAVPIPTIKEEPTMPKLSDVRIVYLPPATVCSSHAIGPNAEDVAGPKMDAFVRASGLADIKPDLRMYGFNHPNGTQPDGSDHGYEVWVTIPEGFAVSEGLTVKQFPGGLYAAHMIPIGNFEEWQWIVTWVEDSPDFEPRWGDADCMAGLLEEHLNYYSYVKGLTPEKEPFQLDLLVPVTRK